MRFWVGFSCGVVFGLLLGGYGAAFLFFDEYMNAPPKPVKQVPALPIEQIPIKEGGFAPSLSDQPLEQIIQQKEKKDQAKKVHEEIPPPPPPPPPPTALPAEAVDPWELED
jgi:hypothetical protein